METLFIGRNVIFLDYTESTNSYAINMLKNVNLAEGTIIQTSHQTNGRGQRGNAWNSEKSANLTASLIIKPNFLDLKNQYFLYQISALACYDALTEILNKSHFDIKIKWPNDILVNNLKIAGILIENNISNSKINWSIIGFGLNINQINFDDNYKATSLKKLCNESIDITMMLQLFCKHFEKYYLMLKSNKYNQIKENYLNCFFGLNSWMSFETEGNTKQFFIEGINEGGLLQLKAENGSIHYFDVKSIKWKY
jgi:BirA family biotin operon repressor/biotin-[acetyl-CoA-carboxylase] ligase